MPRATSTQHTQPLANAAATFSRTYVAEESPPTPAITSITGQGGRGPEWVAAGAAGEAGAGAGGKAQSKTNVSPGALAAGTYDRL